MFVSIVFGMHRRDRACETYSSEREVDPKIQSTKEFEHWNYQPLLHVHTYTPTYTVCLNTLERQFGEKNCFFS